MRIGSPEHKELFCRNFIDSHRAYEPPELPWPELDETSLARLRAIPIWTMALEVEIGAGLMLAGFAKTEQDPLVRNALELQGYEEDRHGRLLAYMVDRYGLHANPTKFNEAPSRRAFVDFGYNECVDSFAGFGIFRLACKARVLPESLTSLFSRVIFEEARHIVFFVNWIAWDRCRRGLHGSAAQALPALAGYGGAILRRVQGGSKIAGAETKGDANLDLFADVMADLTPAKFLRTCIEENDRYMQDFDPRLIRPRVIPALGRVALAIFEAISYIRALLANGAKTRQEGAR
jgi:hypothetical protein